eukprot:5889965-Alexandrium_andersonii.AAC.1
MPLGLRPNEVGARAEVPVERRGKIVPKVKGSATKRSERNESQSHGPEKSRRRTGDLAGEEDREAGGGGFYSYPGERGHRVGCPK